MKSNDINNVNFCHAMLHDAYCASVLLDELHWNLSQVDDKNKELARLTHQMRCATMGLEAAIKPWKDSLGPADLGKDAA